MRIDLVYCLQRQTSGSYVKLNRDYKPLGSETHTWIDYDSLDGVALTIGPEDAARISWCDDSNTDCVYLFNDGCAPWLNEKCRADYFERLALT